MSKGYISGSSQGRHSEKKFELKFEQWQESYAEICKGVVRDTVLNKPELRSGSVIPTLGFFFAGLFG